MRTFFFTFTLCILGLISNTEATLAATTQPTDNLLFQLGVSLMMTENYLEAENCFAKLAADDSGEVAIYNNRGVNLAMWAMSLLKKDEAENQIKYVFPFEVAPNLGTKGSDTEEEQRKAKITQLFESAAAQFEHCITLAPDFAGGYLNLASAQALLSCWQENPALLGLAFQNINTAEEKAAEYSTTKGYCLIVKGIIYDYLDNGTKSEAHSKSEAYFDLALRQHEVHPDLKLASLAERNLAVASGSPAVFVNKNGEKYSVMEDDPEAIDGISLRQLMSSGNLAPDQEVATLGVATLYRKDYPQSALYIYFKDAERFLFFHHTGERYAGSTSKGIHLGDSEAYVKEAYGTPLRIQPALGGKFLFYKKAKLLFFIGNDQKVKDWMVWRGKG